MPVGQSVGVWGVDHPFYHPPFHSSSDPRMSIKFGKK